MTSYHRAFSTGLVSLVITALCAAPGWAATSSINPIADSFVTPGSDGSLSNNNYGAGGLLSVAAPGKPQGEFQSVLQFDLSATKTSFDAQFGAGLWSIESVTLQLTATPVNNAIFNAISAGQFEISWMQNDSWTEGTGTPTVPTTTGITWNTLPNFLGPNDEDVGTFSFNGATSGSTTYTLTLTSGFTADMLAGGVISLRTLAADTDVSYLFNSRNFNTVASRPLLTVTAVPEPSSGMLALAGLLLLIRARLRRR
ncbi:MAG: hypothetical protein QOE73_407 [Verrucomicrobiota bacterium]